MKKFLSYIGYLSLATFFVAIAANPAVGASFNCEKAAIPVEKTICAYYDISKLDETLDAIYRALRSGRDGAERKSLEHEQRRWLAQRNSCGDPACIRGAYANRIRELRRMETASRWVAGQENAESQSGVCAYVAGMANTNRLQEVVLKNRPSNNSSPPAPTDLASTGAVFLDRLDINNDGRPENVYISAYGVADSGSLVAYDSNMRRIGFTTSPEDDWESDNLRWAADRNIIRYEGVHYFVGRSADKLNYVSKIGPDNVEKVHCEFDQKQNSAGQVVNYVLSEFDALMRAARESHKSPWAYAFDRPGVEKTKLLIKNGGNVNDTISGESLLTSVVSRRRDDLLELLLKNGADPNRRNSGIPPLEEAIGRGTDDSLAILLRAGAKLNIENTDPIIQAINYGQASKLKIIINAGIRPEQRHLDFARGRGKRELNPNIIEVFKGQRTSPEIIQLLESACCVNSTRMVR